MDSKPLHASPSGLATDVRRTRRRKRRLWLLLALVLLPVLAWLTRGAVMNPLLARTAERVAPMFGWHVEIESLQGDWFRRLAVRGLRIRAASGEASLRALQADELECDFDLREVLRAGIGGVHEVSAAGLDGEIQLRASGPREDAPPGFALALPEHLPRVDVKRAALRIRFPNDEELALEDIELTLRPREGTSERDEARLVVERVTPPPSIASSTARLEATVSRDATAPSVIRVDRLAVVAGDDRLVADSLEVPLAWENPEQLIAALRGRVAIDAPDPLSLALRRKGRVLWLGPLHAEIRADSSGIAVERGELGFPGGTLSQLRGTLAVSPSPSVDVSANARIDDLAPLGELLGSPRWQGTVQGSVQLRGELSAPVLTAHLVGDDCGFGGRPVGDFVLDGETDFRSIRVSSFHATGRAGEIDVSGAIDLVARSFAGATLRARVEHPEVLLDGAPTGRITLEADLDGPWVAPSGRLRADAPLLEHSAGRLEDVTLEAHSDGSRIDIDRLVARTIHGDVLVRGSLERERIVVEQLGLRKGEEELLALTATVPVDANEGGFARSGALAIQGSLRLPAALLPSWSNAEVEIAAEQAATATIDLSGSIDAPRGRIAVDAPALRITPLRDGGGLPKRASLVASIEVGDAIVLEGFRLAGDEIGTLRASGRSSLRPDVHELVETRGEALLDAPFELSAQAELGQVDWIGALLASIRRVSGSAEATVELSGTPREPSVRGSLRVTGGELRLASAFPPLQAVTAELALEGNRIVIREFFAEIGAAPLVARGAVELSPGQSPTIDLELDGTNILIARSSTLRVRADAKLHVAGTYAQPRVTGKLDLRNTRLAYDIDFLGMIQRRGTSAPETQGLTLFSLREPPLSELQLDVEIGALEPIKFNSNVAEASIRPALRIGGTGAIPAPEGRVFLDSMELKMPGGTFRFPGGTVIFDRTDPFRPRLELIGEARLAGHDVTMDISGPIDAPVVHLESSPPLANERLVLLVVSGTLPPEGLRDSSELAARSISLYVARDAFSRWFWGPSDNEDDDSIFDRFEIVTGSEASQAGVLSTEASLRVRKEVFVTNDSLYVVAERDVYEDYNMGLRIVFRFR